MADQNICELHQVPLQVKTVPIRYGLPMYDEAFDVKDLLFPNSHSYALGGCIIDDEPEPPYKMSVCMECRKAERKWRKENLPASQGDNDLSDLFRKAYLSRQGSSDSDR